MTRTSRLSRPMLTILSGLLLSSLVLSGCSRGGKSAETTATPPLQLQKEDVLRVATGVQQGGPSVTGAIQPERRADLRAEVSAVVLQVLKDNGEVVRKGDLLVRLDDTSIRDSLQSAEESLRASTQAFEQAERQLQRLKTLQAQGMTSQQSAEDAEVRRNNAQSDLVAAKARVAAAKQQLQRTEVRAPFDGVVSDRKASPGDTAQIGKELVKVIDPSSLRFEGLVSADRLSQLKVGQSVSFKVNGYGEQVFEGTLRRIDAAANAVTRQVAVLISFDGSQRPGAAGLYAEGTVATEVRQALQLPEAALVREGDKTSVWVYQDGVIKKQTLQMGTRDARSGRWEVLQGVKPGDWVLSHPTTVLKDGQKASLAAAAASAASAARGG